jgi:hypothetical protein
MISGAWLDARPFDREGGFSAVCNACRIKRGSPSVPLASSVFRCFVRQLLGVGDGWMSVLTPDWGRRKTRSRAPLNQLSRSLLPKDESRRDTTLGATVSASSSKHG